MDRKPCSDVFRPEGIGRARAAVLAAAIFCVVCGPVRAAGIADGAWTGDLKTRGAPLPVKLTLAGADSTWTSLTGGRRPGRNPCLDRAFPIAIVERTDTALKIAIDADALVKGCFKGTVTLSLEGSGELAGSTDTGGEIRLRHE